MAAGTTSSSDYKKQVLKPFKGLYSNDLTSAINFLQGQNGSSKSAIPVDVDLPFLYGIEPQMGQEERTRQIKFVRNVWAKARTGQGSYVAVAERVSQLDALLREQLGDLGSTAVWEECFEVRELARQDGQNDLAEVLKADFSVYKVVTSERAEEVATRIGLRGITKSEVHAAVQSAGLALVEPFTEPVVTLHAMFRQLEATGYPTVAAACFLDNAPTSYKIVDRFESSGPLSLSASQAKKALITIETAGSIDGTTKAAVRSVLIQFSNKSDQDIHAHALRQVIEIARRELQSSGSPTFMIRKLSELGVDPVDSGRIALQLEGSNLGTSLTEISSLLGEGSLREARRRVSTIAANAPRQEVDSLTARIDVAEKHVAALRTEAQAAISSHDVANAAAKLTLAIDIASDDEELVALLSGLPPGPPEGLAASPQGESDAVQLLWRAGFASTPDTNYSIVRKTAAPPADIRDGETIAARLKETTFDDADPIAGVRVWYGVAALNKDSTSTLAVASIDHAPPVRTLEATSDESSISLSWDQPKSANGAEVTMTGPDGRAQPVKSVGQSATATDLVTGQRYTIAVTALYRAGGQTVRSLTQSIDATPRADAKPVGPLYIDLVASSPGSVAARWDQPAHHDVQVWMFQRKPDWAFGTRVSRDQLERSPGSQLTGRFERTNGQGTITATVGAGLHHYLLLTQDGQSYVVGGSDEKAVCPAIEDVNVERHQDELVISCPWPGEDFDVEVTWTSNTDSGSAVVTSDQYVRDGGIRIKPGTSTTTLTLKSTVQGSKSWTSPIVQVEVPGSLQEASYEIGWRGRLPRMPKTAVCTFRASQPVEARVQVGVSAGRYLPATKADYQVVTEFDVKIRGANDKFEHTLDVPRMSRPYWLRVFAADDESLFLVDPHTQTMRGR